MIAPNTTYIASYYAPNGSYAHQTNGLNQAVTRGDLTALGGSTSGGNGVYLYGSGGFPTQSYLNTNYFVDVLFAAQGSEPPTPDPDPEPPTPEPPTTSYTCLQRYYVSTSGSNTAAGTSSSPWRTINHALFGRSAGDCVVVKPGTYTETVWWTGGGGSSDTASGYVALISEQLHQAKLRAPQGSYSTLNMRNHYTLVDGFDVVGGDGHGVDIEGAHHVKVLNMKAHDSGGSGISAQKGEYFTFEGNTVYGNAATNGYQTSGISIYWARPISGNTSDMGFRNVLRNNISFDNIESAAITGEHTDGNGIIIDDFQHTQYTQSPPQIPYPYRTLVENNLVYGNGGKGIQVTWSDHVTVRHNTAYFNNRDNLNPGTWRGEITNQQSSDNVYVNNVTYADPGVNSNNVGLGNFAYSSYTNQGVVFRNNLTYQGVAGQTSARSEGNASAITAAQGNLLGVNPRFVAPSLTATANFRTQMTSAVIDAGTTAYGTPQDDLDGSTRPQGSGYDLGAYEMK